MEAGRPLDFELEMAGEPTTLELREFALELNAQGEPLHHLRVSDCSDDPSSPCALVTTSPRLRVSLQPLAETRRLVVSGTWFSPPVLRTNDTREVSLASWAWSLNR